MELFKFIIHALQFMETTFGDKNRLTLHYFVMNFNEYLPHSYSI